MKDVIRMVGNTREYKVTADNMSDACDKVFEKHNQRLTDTSTVGHIGQTVLNMTD